MRPLSMTCTSLCIAGFREGVVFPWCSTLDHYEEHWWKLRFGCRLQLRRCRIAVSSWVTWQLARVTRAVSIICMHWWVTWRSSCSTLTASFNILGTSTLLSSWTYRNRCEGHNTLTAASGHTGKRGGKKREGEREREVKCHPCSYANKKYMTCLIMIVRSETCHMYELFKVTHALKLYHVKCICGIIWEFFDWPSLLVCALCSEIRT